MKRYTRAELLQASGARAEDLTYLEGRRLLVPNRPWRLFGSRSEYYTEGQVAVLRWLVSARRAAEASRRACRPEGSPGSGGEPRKE